MQIRIEHEPRFATAVPCARQERTHAALARASFALATGRGSLDDFIEQLTVRAHPVLERGRGLVGCVIGIDGDVCRVERPVLVGCPPGTYEALCSAALAISTSETRSALFGGGRAGLASERLALTPEEYLTRRELTHLSRAGIVDHVFLRLEIRSEGEHKACFLFAPCPGLGSLKARERTALSELSVELSAALRLHEALHAERADAGGAAPPSSRSGLLKLCLSGGSRRAEPEQALALWRELLDGRWSLLAQANARGKRVLLVRRNGTGTSPWPSLTEREKHAARSVLMGESNKTIGFDLGISPAATTAFVGSAIRKLGLRSRAELSGAFRAPRPRP